MITPAFSLDFVSATLDPRVTFTRSGATATRTNSSGYVEIVAADVPRFDFDPITLACKGLLVEGSSQNILNYSQDFTQSLWTKTNVSVTANATTAPTGTSIGSKIIENTATNLHRLEMPQSPRAIAAGTTVTFSIYAKAAERTFIYITDDSGTAFWTAYFNLSNGTIGNIGTQSFATITPAGNGWYRCSLTYTTTATLLRGRYGLAISNGVASYTGDGTSGAFFWGSQLEIGTLTSYVPNLLLAFTTRNPDVATITGTNFSDWWQADKGGATVQALPSTVSGIRPLIQFDDGTANEIIALRGNTTNPELYVVDGGTPQAQIDAGTIAANTAYSLTGWWQTNFCAARKDNGARVEDLTATIPTVTQARIGSDGTNYLNGHLATINYYDQFSSQIYTRRKNKVVFNVI
jgi:hypothetical protein